MALEDADFDLVDVMQGALSMFTQSAEAKGLELGSSYSPAGSAIGLRGDPLRLRQIIVNLVGNALKFTDKGSVRVQVILTQPPIDGLAQIQIHVVDTGIGIALDAQDKIFDHFSQADSSTTRRFGGTGLGLSICRNLLGKMGGSISVKSQPGKGSTFMIELMLPMSKLTYQSTTADSSSVSPADTGTAAPKAYTAKPHSAIPASTASPASPACLSGRVLLVEDYPINQMLAKALLSKLGLDWQLACDGSQAVELVRTHDFDLVLMDCQMPVMDGFEATTAIRQLPDRRGAHLPIVALTANTMPGDEKKCMDAGMDGFLAKPYTLATLHAMLARWLPALEDSSMGGAKTASDVGATLDAPNVTAALKSTASATLKPAINGAILRTLREFEANGSMNLAKTVFNTFIDTSDASRAQVQAAINNSDAAALSQAAHAMKSGSANIGAEILAGVYAELEQMGRNGHLGDAAAAWRRAEYEHERAITHLKELLLTLG
ncbi:ATP-binding protein [Roseateles sp. GG27B]